MHISCTICTELYLANDETGVTKCGHLFHIDCVKPWLQKHKTCPHCRADSLFNDLRRVFFTEINDEDVHLNRNCKIDSLQAIVASGKEHVKKVKIDLRQAENDLLDMYKHIKIYEKEIQNLKILNDALLENSDKIECQNKKLMEQASFTAIVKNRLLSESSDAEFENSNNDEDAFDIIELKTINASLEEENQRNITEIKYLEEQLNKAIIRNEELEFELHKLKDDMKKIDKPVLKEKDEEKQRVDQKKKLPIEIKNVKGKNRNESLTKIDSKVDRYLKTAKKKQNVKTSKSNINVESEPTMSKQQTRSSESFRKAREQISKLKLCSTSDTNITQELVPHDTTNAFKESECKDSKIVDQIQTLFENNLKTGEKKHENNHLKQNKNESFRKNREVFLAACLQSPTDSTKQLEENYTPPILHDRKDNTPIRPPMPPPRILKPFSILSSRRAPCPPPRSRTDRNGIIFNNDNNNLQNSLHALEAQSRTPVIEHPLTIENIIRTPPVGAIPLLGMCKAEFSEKKNTCATDEGPMENEDTSKVNNKEQKKSSLNESNVSYFLNFNSSDLL